MQDSVALCIFLQQVTFEGFLLNPMHLAISQLLHHVCDKSMRKLYPVEVFFPEFWIFEYNFTGSPSCIGSTWLPYVTIKVANEWHILKKERQQLVSIKIICEYISRLFIIRLFLNILCAKIMFAKIRFQY